MNIGLELTPKELAILKMVCDDKSNIEIAEHLECTQRNFEKQKSKLYIKTSTHSNVGLLKWAVLNNLYKIKRPYNRKNKKGLK